MRLFPIVPIVVLLLAAGCSHQDFGRPVGGRIADMMPSMPGTPTLDEEAAEREAAQRYERLQRVQSAWESENLHTDRTYRIGTEDVLDVAILSLDQPGEVTHIERTVSRNGTLSLPLVGTVWAQGFTVGEMERMLKACYDGKYLKDPDLVVTVKQYRSEPLVVTGEVKKPGVYFLQYERGSLLEVLSQAGGLTANAGREVLVIRGGNEAPDTNAVARIDTPPAEDPATPEAGPETAPGVIAIDLNQLIDQGDLRLNIWVRKGDVVNVLPRRRGYVYVLGYVQRPGAYVIERDTPVSTLQAVALAGGLLPTARAENSLLIRQSDLGPTVVPLDLTRSRSGAPLPTVQAGDTLLVGSSALARLSEFVRPSVGAGMSYTPAP